MDRYSPLAPAFVRALLLPVGQIERERFLELVEAWKREASVVRLRDLEPRVGDDELLLAPRAFPQGSLIYNYSASLPSEHHHQLSPYELFREPLLVLGVVDGLGPGAASGLQELGEASRYLRERHQRVVSRQLLVIHHAGDSTSAEPAENVVQLSSAALSDTALLKDAVLEVSARFLRELSTYMRALQASPSVSTPGQTARSLQRPVSSRENDKPPPSGRSTPTQASEAGSPIDSSGVRTPPYGRSSPATSFDQIATNAQNALSRSESRAGRAKHGGRASSQDRPSTAGFGSLSQDKLKNRGRARVGIVTGYLYMMAGQWSEALKVLVDGTHKARALSDFLWHAKGMEGVVVCLLLHAWATIDFQIPTICHPMSDRATSGHSQRFSINQSSDFRTPEAAQKAALHKLSTYLPDLIKQILNLYDSGEASLELPFLVISEATIRSCKLLLALRPDGELSPDTINMFIERPTSANSAAASSVPDIPTASSKVSNSQVASMLAEAQPLPEDNVPVPDHVAILAGVSSVYTSLGMRRKRAVVMREMVVKLTQALSQARKRGAAEVGMHPAATLSADNGAEAILTAMELSGGLHQMLEDVVGSFGMSLSSEPDVMSAMLADASGNEMLKRKVLTELSAFCEASPDLEGLLRVNAALLKASSSRNGDHSSSSTVIHEALSQEEQIRLTSTITRSAGITKHLGLPRLEARYWDPFLVCDVVFLAPGDDHTVVEYSSLKTASTLPSAQSTSNPLLYDPNASRPGTATDVKHPPTVLVEGETVECVVKLQNSCEVPVEIESLALVLEGPQLSIDTRPITLGPLRVQQVPLTAQATSTGECKITACRIKINGCEEQDFPIFKKPRATTATSLIKHAGQEEGVLPIDRPNPPVQETVPATVIEAQPLLTLQDTLSFEEGVMLLDGESVEIDVALKNTSTVTAELLEFSTSSDVLSVEEDFVGVQIPPGESTRRRLILLAKPGVSHAQATLVYGRSDRQSHDTRHVRVLSVPIRVTVNASIQLQNLEILPARRSDDNDLTLSLDIGNAWPRTLGFECATKGYYRQHDKSSQSSVQGTLAPGQIQRIFLSIERPDLAHDASLESFREALITRLTGKWQGDGRQGNIDFSKLRPHADVLEPLRCEPVKLQLEVLDSELRNKITVKAGTFATIRARVTDNGATAVPLLVNLRPLSADTADAAAEERRVAVAGQQHRILPPLAAESDTHADFSVCPLLGGTLVLVGSVRPAQMLREIKGENDGWNVQRRLTLRVV